MTRSDLVMVEREVLADALAFLESEMHWSQPAPDMGEEPSDQFTYDAIPVAMALRAALQSVEGGVQVAAKQESCPESAPRTETTVRDWRKSVFTYEHDDAAGHLYYFAPQVTAPGPFLEQRHVQAIVDIASDGTFAGVELIDNMPPLNSGGADTKSDGGVESRHAETGNKSGAAPEAEQSSSATSFVRASGPEDKTSKPRAGVTPGPSDQLTKTPSADHDAGNLRGLAEPNHQPHAVSQGWRDDMENAPDNIPVLLAWQDWRDGQWCMEIGPAITGQRYANGYSSISHHGSATHWMPLPAPPSPAKTGGAE